MSGQEIVAAPDPEEPKVVNLMEALKASVESAKGGSGRKAAGGRRSGRAASARVKSKMAPSAAGVKRKTRGG